MTGQLLRVGTRASELALTQSGWAAAQIARASQAEFELVHIRTEGDINLGPLASIGGTGVFVTAVRAALLDRRCDVIVHSFKDLPTQAADDITVAAVPTREDPLDALCSRDNWTLDALPAGARVGTGSPRRAAQLLAYRPDLQIVAVRGNVPTRLAKATSGELDAVVLACAGLNRLGLSAAITQVLEPHIMLPAPSQGALAIECRTVDSDKAWYAAGLTALEDRATRASATAERALLSTLEAGCLAPVGALATTDNDRLTLTAAVFAVDGSAQIRAELSGFAVDAAAIGQELARTLLDQGAGNLLT